jgi:hypothetical protein
LHSSLLDNSGVVYFNLDIAVISAFCPSDNPKVTGTDEFDVKASPSLRSLLQNVTEMVEIK